jgi:prostaglandin reductase 1
MSRRAKKFIYSTAFKGDPKLSDFTLEEEDLPELKDEEILIEAQFLSVDPYMSAYMRNSPTNVLMIGGQVAKVIESKNEKYQKGTFVYAHVGWRNLTIVNPKDHKANMAFYALPDNFEGLSPSLGVGILGAPGNTAYFGFLELCKPQPGETVVVTGAAGAVGSLVGQIAKIKGCKVIGFAGSDEKCKWLEDELKFDKAINYKVGNMAEALKKAAPGGVDCYFDNVGGELSSIIIHQMKLRGRISVCGSISGYSGNKIMVPDPQKMFVFNQLKMEGFIVSRWDSQWMEGLTQMAKWVHEGKLKYHETFTNGFENMPKAFIEMLNGKNTGKAVVRA